ncbi:MAG: DinB family protein [Candidatus Acidiferrales bacterium]
MQPEGRRKQLEAFGRGPGLLSEALRKCPKKMWLYRPAADRWSIHEIILHLADSEAEAYVRCRQFIAQPGSPALVYDASLWASSLGYFHQSTREALSLITRLRKMTYQILRYIPDTVWAHTAQHPKKGTMTLDGWLDLQLSHIPHHIEQIHENHAEWAKTHRQRKPAVRLVAASAAKEVALASFGRPVEFAD